MENKKIPCYEIVATRLNEADFFKLRLAVRDAKVNQTEFLRQLIKNHLSIKDNTPVT